jgi:hypothetical protein
VLVLPKLSESLAGGMELLSLWPFSQGEVSGRVDSFVDRLFAEGEGAWSLELADEGGPDLWQRVAMGGYPEVQTRKAARRRRAWFDFRGLRRLAETVGDKFLRGVVLYGGTEVVPFEANLFAVPISALWR